MNKQWLAKSWLAVLFVLALGTLSIKISMAESKQGVGLQLDELKTERVSPASRFGLGLALGDPSGITGKLWLDRIQALNFSLGSPMGAAGVGFYADYLRHLYVFKQEPRLPIYVGGGLLFGGNSDEVFTGVRAVFGITYLFHEPFDVFFEIDPHFLVLPELGMGIGLALGARIYFSQ